MAVKEIKNPSANKTKSQKVKDKGKKLVQGRKNSKKPEKKIPLKSLNKQEVTVKETPKDKGGRPTKKKEDTISKLKYAFEMNMTQEEACFYAGIDTVTYWRWKEKDLCFAREMWYYENFFRFQANKNMSVHLQTFKADPFKALEKFDDRYKPVAEDHSTKNLVIINLPKLTPEEQIALDSTPSINLDIEIPDDVREKLLANGLINDGN